jgi:hypothetical protein
MCRSLRKEEGGADFSSFFERKKTAALLSRSHRRTEGGLGLWLIATGWLWHQAKPIFKRNWLEFSGVPANELF